MSRRRLALFVVGLFVAGVVTAAPALAATPTVTGVTPTSAYVSDATRTLAYDVRTGTVLRRLALGPASGGVVVTDGAVYGYDYSDRSLVRDDLVPDAAVARPSAAAMSPATAR